MADKLLPGASATTVSSPIWHLLYQTKKGPLFYTRLTTRGKWYPLPLSFGACLTSPITLLFVPEYTMAFPPVSP